jgi:hypothetical protein
MVNGDWNAFLADKNGIEGIVNIRGGTKNLGFDGHLESSLLLYALLIL